MDHSSAFASYPITLPPLSNCKLAFAVLTLSTAAFSLSRLKKNTGQSVCASQGVDSMSVMWDFTMVLSLQQLVTVALHVQHLTLV